MMVVGGEGKEEQRVVIRCKVSVLQNEEFWRWMVVIVAHFECT
jgi:hypothetical protein